MALSGPPASTTQRLINSIAATISRSDWTIFSECIRAIPLDGIAKRSLRNRFNHEIYIPAAKSFLQQHLNTAAINQARTHAWSQGNHDIHVAPWTSLTTGDRTKYASMQNPSRFERRAKAMEYSYGFVATHDCILA